jgi:hypothetical protein
VYVNGAVASAWFISVPGRSHRNAWAVASYTVLPLAGVLPYYRQTNPVLCGIARYAIDEILADHRSSA